MVPGSCSLRPILMRVFHRKKGKHLTIGGKGTRFRTRLRLRAHLWPALMPFPALSPLRIRKTRGVWVWLAVMCSERFERFMALDAADARCITGVLVVLEGCPC